MAPSSSSLAETSANPPAERGVPLRFAIPAHTSRFAQWPPGYPRAVPDPLSQWHCLSKDPLPNPSTEASLRDNIHLGLQHRLEVDQQAAEIKQATVGLQVNQKIDVAMGIALAAGHGTKDPNVSRPASPEVCPKSYARKWPAPIIRQRYSSRLISHSTNFNNSALER